jgi:transposase
MEDALQSYTAGTDILDEPPHEDHLGKGKFQAQPSRNRRKAMRQSQPARVLASIHGPAKNLYSLDLPNKNDLSYNSPHRFNPGGLPRRPVTSPSAPNGSAQYALPDSLYTILARCLQHITAPSPVGAFECTQQELGLLHAKGFTSESPEKWAAALVTPNSTVAASIFEPGDEVPPFFLLLLFLRRKHMQISALGVIMRHLNSRLDVDPVNWQILKILTIRLLRHARVQWYESIPWIASMFTAQAVRIHGDGNDAESMSPRMLSDMTRFCNSLLALISLPTSKNPMLASRHQESAQFHILQFMANRTPPITVTRPGFRSVTRIQLAHAKTDQERDWAELKGPSWPPWKEDRTAMDEGKSYEFGASRASKILHRMFEAGYSGGPWEDVAAVYAGWDTDLSPTIQTRALLHRLPIRLRNKQFLANMLWAGRIRTTRTRREAWACFLAHEQAGTPTHDEIYLAMFEKLHHNEAVRLSETDSHLESEVSPEESHALEQPPPALLPGDMKEVLPNPASPLHLVHLSEPVPTYEQLYHRMLTKGLRPSHRLLAFLLETHPDFGTVVKLLDMANDDFDGGMGCLARGVHDDDSVRKVPGYLLTAFIRFLCRFGRYTEAPLEKPRLLPPEQHAYQFKINKHYLLEYAHALLSHYAPAYSPAWTVFVEKLVYAYFDIGTSHSKSVSATGRSQIQYRIAINILDAIKDVDLDIDDDLFRHICAVTRFAAQAAHRGNSSMAETDSVLTTGPQRLRFLFHGLTGAQTSTKQAQASLQPIDVPPHVPGPAELHAYVRALGLLRDYEGLYSFSTWLAKHHDEVVARAHAQHGGSNMLFRTLVALRAAMSGWLEEGNDVRPSAPAELRELVKAQINSAKALGGWPSKKYVGMYVKGHLRNSTPSVGGR